MFGFSFIPDSSIFWFSFTPVSLVATFFFQGRVGRAGGVGLCYRFLRRMLCKF